MRINYTLENGYIVSYSAIPFDESKPFIDVDEKDLIHIMTQKCKVRDGELDLTKALEKEAANSARAGLEAELYTLLEWFKKYDEEAIQYARQIRMRGESEVDIATLDAQAEQNASRINEIKELLK